MILSFLPIAIWSAKHKVALLFEMFLTCAGGGLRMTYRLGLWRLFPIDVVEDVPLVAIIVSTCTFVF